MEPGFGHPQRGRRRGGHSANTVATAHVVGFNSPNTTFTVGKINEGAINPGDANALQARTIGVTGSNNTLIFDSGTVGVPAEINILGNFAGATGVSNPYAFRTKQVLNSDLLVTVQPRNGNPDGSQIVINFLGADSTFSGPGGIIKDGQGTLAFADTAKAFEGPTLVKLGRLRFNDASSQAGGFTKTSAVTVLAGGQFAFDQANVAGKNTFGEALAVRPVVTLNGDGIPTFGGAIRVTTGRITVMDNPVVLASDSSIGIISSATDLTAKLTLPQVISGPGALIKESLNGPGSATLLLTAANTYLGGTVVNAGTLTLSGAGTLGATTGKLTVNSVNTNGAAGQTATVNLNPGFATTVGSLSGTATAGNTAVINNPVGLTVNQTVSGTYNGAIAGNGGITLGNLSTGTLTLTGNLTYAGSTTVQAGTLNLPKLRTTDVVSITGGTLQIAHSAPAGANPESGDNNFVSRPTSLAISNNGAAPQLRVYDGALDLTNNDLIVDYSGASPIADVEDMVRAGYNGGNWLGKGITSSTAANRRPTACWCSACPTTPTARWLRSSRPSMDRSSIPRRSS